jgi:hypothetical protein
VNLPVARVLAGATLVALALSGCVRLDLQTTLTDHDTADSTLVVAMADDTAGMPGSDAAGVGPEATPEPTADATPTEGAHPADGVISDWGTPITLATFLVLVIGGLVAYMVSRRQRKAADQTQA